MNRKHHSLKIESEYYNDIAKGLKNFEIRKNDRDYKLGDIVHLQEFKDNEYTGREYAPLEIKYIFHGGEYGLDSNYCAFGW